VKCLVESSVELRGRHDGAGHNAQMYLAEWLEPRAQHSGERGDSGYHSGKTRFAYFAAHDLNRQLRTKLRPNLSVASSYCVPIYGVRSTIGRGRNVLPRRLRACGAGPDIRFRCIAPQTNPAGLVWAFALSG
jgi:hypothetical protein